MKLSLAVYTPGSKCLYFRCICGSRFGFKTGLPPKDKQVISARCPGCSRVRPYSVRVKEIRTEKEEK